MFCVGKHLSIVKVIFITAFWCFSVLSLISRLLWHAQRCSLISWLFSIFLLSYFLFSVAVDLGWSALFLFVKPFFGLLIFFSFVLLLCNLVVNVFTVDYKYEKDLNFFYTFVSGYFNPTLQTLFRAPYIQIIRRFDVFNKKVVFLIIICKSEFTFQRFYIKNNQYYTFLHITLWNCKNQL